MTPRDELRQRLAAAVADALYGLGAGEFNKATGYTVRYESERCADAVLGVVAAHLADPATIEQAARSICESFGRDPDDIRKPDERSTTMFAPYPIWQEYEAKARAALASILPPSEQS